ncbi:MAG TPA: hypothetical protein VKX28_16865 [Xanthobacteraceae bacterium]|nr:hypothetical protein [Xanthobacteraceae bacterium]
MKPLVMKARICCATSSPTPTRPTGRDLGEQVAPRRVRHGGADRRVEDRPLAAGAQLAVTLSDYAGW